MEHVPAPCDLEFRRAFEAQEIALSEFCHRAHLRLAYVYLCESAPAAAHERLRAALDAFLRRHGLPADKYHVTVTHAWLLAVRHFMAKAGPTRSFDEWADRCPEALDPTILRTHYSARALASDEARRTFLEPDLTPIPRYVDD